MRKTDRLSSDSYYVSAERTWNTYANESYDVHRLFADWSPKSGSLADLSVKLTVDNVLNSFHYAALSGDSAPSQGRNAKVSLSYSF